jgi:hypothetical protein
MKEIERRAFPAGERVLGMVSAARMQDNLGSAFSNNAIMGDICRFIGEHGGPSDYRMPKGSEFGFSGAGGHDWGDANWYVSATAVFSQSEIPSTGPNGQ